MGRPLESIEHHHLAGNASKLSIADLKARAGSQPVPGQVVGGRPHCPRSLSPAAKKIWHKVVRLLEARAVISEGDGELIELYAVTKERWATAVADISARGHMISEQKYSKSGDPYDVVVENPYLKIATDAESQLIQLSAKLGLTPKDRDGITRLKQTPGKGASNVPEWARGMLNEH